jgi:putative FmdB family regulatory protein
LPLYAYRCTKCGHRFEKIQNFSSAQELVCPVCQGVLERPLTAPRLHFKGAGWYVNDYAAKSSAPASESGPESGSGGASETAKGAAPAETKAPSTASESASSTPAEKPAPTAGAAPSSPAPGTST